MTEGHTADLALALAAARAAGEATMEWFRTDLEVRAKGPDQPVTEADLRADEILAERLRGARPGYGWLSEESADDPARLERDRVWIIDPIDGTRSFIRGYREFTVSVGLAEAGEPVVGVIYNPATEDAFWATRGGGAFRTRRWDGTAPPAGEVRERMRVVEPASGEPPALLASRSEIARGEMERFSHSCDIRPMGSTAYKMAGVAAGMGHGFVSGGPKSEWDVVAGALILEEAGGVVTDGAGRPLRFNQAQTGLKGLVAAGPALHRELLGMSNEGRD